MLHIRCFLCFFCYPFCPIPLVLAYLPLLDSILGFIFYSPLFFQSLGVGSIKFYFYRFPLLNQVTRFFTDPWLNFLCLITWNFLCCHIISLLLGYAICLLQLSFWLICFVIFPSSLCNISNLFLSSKRNCLLHPSFSSF